MGIRAPIVVFDKIYINNIDDLKTFITNHILLELKDIFTTNNEVYVKIIALDVTGVEELDDFLRLSALRNYGIYSELRLYTGQPIPCWNYETEIVPAKRYGKNYTKAKNENGNTNEWSDSVKKTYKNFNFGICYKASYDKNMNDIMA